MRILTVVAVPAAVLLSCCIRQRLATRPHLLAPREVAARGCWSMPVEVKSGDSTVTIILDSAVVVDSFHVFRQAAGLVKVQRVPGLLARFPESIANYYAGALWYSLPDTAVVGVMLWHGGGGGIRVDGELRDDSVIGRFTHFGMDTPAVVRPGYVILRRVPCAAPSN